MRWFRNHFIFSAIAAILLCAGAAALFLWRSEAVSREDIALSGSRATVRGEIFSLEVVRTPEEQERGLGFRESLCERCGMLFLFPYSDRHGFWMKGMRFPIDILWIRNETIVHIERSVDFRDQRRVYRPDQPADRVLELNAGVCDRIGIREGDGISFVL